MELIGYVELVEVHSWAGHAAYADEALVVQLVDREVALKQE